MSDENGLLNMLAPLMRGGGGEVNATLVQVLGQVVVQLLQLLREERQTIADLRARLERRDAQDPEVFAETMHNAVAAAAPDSVEPWVSLDPKERQVIVEAVRKALR